MYVHYVYQVWKLVVLVCVYACSRVYTVLTGCSAHALLPLTVQKYMSNKGYALN